MSDLASVLCLLERKKLMLEQALTYTTKALNQFLNRTFELSEEMVIANSIVDPSGNIPQANQNKLVLSLINIEKETNKQFSSQVNSSSGFYEQGKSAERYNLNIMLSSCFDSYQEALKMLNVGLLFFQTYSTLNSNSFSFIPKSINRFEFDMENLSFNDMHSLWNAIGSKYQPSAIYKMRLIGIQSDQFTAFIPEVNQVEMKLTSNE